jgi:arylsulfatase A-like enzyme
MKNEIYILVSTFILFGFSSKPDDVRPNIVLLMGDDHGWEETAYNGHEYLKTPILDQMANTGLRLDRFYSAAPTCSPTRGSIITGRHPNRYGTFSPNWSIRPEEISIAQILNKAGYVCGHFGKWHLGPVKANSPTNPGAMGFDKWLSHDNFFEIDPPLSQNGEVPTQFKGESSEILISKAIKFIDKTIQEHKPFFVVVWFGSPHEPYNGNEEDLELYSNLPDKLGEQFVTLTSIETGVQVRRPLDSVLQARYAEITAMDRAIGELRNHLAFRGVQDNTLLWYCGDNGTPASGLFKTPFRGRKGLLYEGGLRVPGIIEWPDRISDPRTSDLISVTSDIFPTICDLTGEPLPNRPIDGMSLLGLINGDMTKRPEPIFFWNYDISYELKVNRQPYIDPELQKGTTPLVKILNGQYTRTFRNYQHSEIQEADYGGSKAVLDNRYKLIINGKTNMVSKELFDIISDPAETNNLISINPNIAEKLEKQLFEWQESVLQSLTGADYNEKN